MERVENAAGSNWFGRGHRLGTQGDSVTSEDYHLNLGRVPAIASAVGIFRVRNNTDAEIQIAMAATGCSCASVQDLPVNIAPGSTSEVSILITVLPEPGEFRRAVRLTTSVGVLFYTITAVVVRPPSENLP